MTLQGGIREVQRSPYKDSPSIVCPRRSQAAVSGPAVCFTWDLYPGDLFSTLILFPTIRWTISPIIIKGATLCDPVPSPTAARYQLQRPEVNRQHPDDS